MCCSAFSREYCNAITFLVGLHPSGRIVHLGNVTVSCTESKLIAHIYIEGTIESSKEIEPHEFIELWLRTYIDDDEITVDNKFYEKDDGPQSTYWRKATE